MAAAGWAGQGTAPADQDQDSAWAPAEDQAARELVVVGEPAEAAALACPELAGAALPTCGSQVCREALAVARERALVVTEVVVEPALEAELAVEVAEGGLEPAVVPARERAAAVVTVVELGPVAEEAAHMEEDLEAAAEAQEPAAE